MTDILFYTLPVLLFLAVLIRRRDTKHQIKQGEAIIKSLESYMKKEQARK